MNRHHIINLISYSIIDGSVLNLGLLLKLIDVAVNKIEVLPNGV